MSLDVRRLCTARSEISDPNAQSLCITRHSRHSTAAHLLESGVELNVIRAWLGHVSLATTNRYAEINLRMKQEALDTCQPPISVAAETSPRRPIWRDDAELLNWLKSI